MRLFNKRFINQVFMAWFIVIAFSCNSKEGLITEISKPNVIVIFTDDMNFEDIGALGGDVLTPNIDALINEGVYFSNFYACSAVCSPSRYNLLTGRYASRSQSLLRQFPVSDPAFLRWNVDIDEGERTIAHVLKENGYYTGFVGKHHNLHNEEMQFHVDENADMYDKNVQAKIAKNYKLLKDTIQKCTGFDYVESIYANNLHALDLPKTMQHHNMDWLTSGGVDFIEKAGDNPFFLYFATTLPHAPDPLSSMYADSRITPAGLLEDTPDVQPGRDDVFARVKNANLPLGKAPYTWLDDAVGTLMQSLEKKNILNNTIILFASDHGGNKAKMTCYEKGVRAPAFIYWKGHFKGLKHIEEITANIDFAPTIYELCGIKTTKEEIIDGRSLMPLLQNKETNWRSSLLLEITYSKAIVTDSWKYIAVRFPEEIENKIAKDKDNLYNHEGTLYSKDNPDGRLKVRYHADKQYPGYFSYDQLYNLQADPGEQNNLAKNTEYSAIVKEMKKMLGIYVSEFPHSFGEFNQIED